VQAELKARGNSGRLLFHTFSNTGWVSFGGILEESIRTGSSIITHICGAVIDSAPQPAVRPWTLLPYFFWIVT
jgi:hypothetical protein